SITVLPKLRFRVRALRSQQVDRLDEWHPGWAGKRAIIERPVCRRPSSTKQQCDASLGGTMSNDTERRAFVLGFVAAAFGAAMRPGSAAAASTAIAEQPWATWDKSQKPVRGGIFRIAAEQYVGKMNPHHWPVNDWVSLSYIYDRP